MVEREFFDALYRESVGYVPVVTFPKEYRRKSNTVPWKDWKFDQFEWFSWPAQADELVAYCEAHRDEDVSVSTSVCHSRSNRKDQITEVNVIHCDADGADPKLFSLPPNMVVRTSPKRTQLYWFLTRPVGVHEAEQLSRAVAYSQRDAGADVGWAVNKLMRVPGTTNTKPDYKKPKVKLERCDNGDTGLRYKPKAMYKAFAAGAAAAASTPKAVPLPLDLPPLSAALSKLPVSSELMRLFTQPPEHTDWNPNASRYLVLWKLGSSLFRLGLSREEVFVVLYHSKSNKYEQDGRSPEELWRDVLKMENDDDNKQMVFVDEDPVTHEPIIERIDRPPDVFFLEAEERVYVRTDTFIDKYREWGVTRTNADPRYHETNAVSIMSTVFSEYGYAIPQYGSMNLEIWAMVLGVTTRSYKTTAARMMLRTLETLFEHGTLGRTVDYLVPDDATPESLQVELGNRGEVSSLFHRDEAQAFIGDAQGGKSYMAGMIPLLTKLYDGVVPSRSRITTGFVPSTRTHLSINLLGVPEKMTQALTIEDFESGFLPRFLFVIGEPGPDDEQALWVGQSDVKAKRDHDVGLDKAITSLKLALKYWHNLCTKNGASTIEMKPIKVDDEAWTRWNKFNYTISHFAKAQQNSSALNAGAGRMAVTVHRLACLLAMENQRDVVDLQDMLTAISWAEKWFSTLMTMIGLVSKNRFAGQVRELVEFVQRRQHVTYREAYREFSNLKPKEFVELIESAEQAGWLIFNRNAIPVSLEVTSNADQD